jgi:selenocysteine lyase/cysteine desulfurase
MLNLDLHDLGCDFYVCSPHKWLCAPPGTGVLYMRKDVQSLLWPTISLFYSKGKGIGTQQKELMLRGQMASPVYRCLKDVMDFQNEIGKDVIQRRVLDLGGYLKEKIIENWGEDKIFSSMEEDLSSGMVAFNPFDDRFQGDPLKIIYKSLADDYNIIIRWVWFKDKLSDANLTQTLRVSTHIYNNYSQIDQLISAMQNIIAQM